MASKISEKTLSKPGMKQYLEILKTVYPRSQSMQEYCLSTVDEIVTLENGLFFIIEKQKIETDFCFGYSCSPYDTEDYDRANRCVTKAYENEQYFIRENLKRYRAVLDLLSDESYVPVLRDHYNARETGNLKSLDFIRCWDWEMKLRQQSAHEIAAENLSENHPYYLLTESDIALVKSAYESAMQRQDKKVRAYLKRYGLTKIRAWSYWRDA
ncbi:MAG: hypothetical protein IKJ65_10695 [Clostridia bacterium]|nr:hypothetical protein [Lentisphaeria bacterium]MBR3929456.1 hypothetical protein [Clostridia bacterium]